MQPEEVDTEIPVPLARPVEYEFVEEEPMHKKAGYEDASMFFGHCTEAACFFSNGTARACIRIGGQTTRGTVRYSNDRSSSRQKPCKAKDVLVRVPNHPLTIVLETRTKGVLLIASIVHFISSIYEKSIRSLCHYYVGLKRQFTYYPIVICLVHVVFVGCLFFSGGTLNSNSKHACCRVSSGIHVVSRTSKYGA